MTHEIYVQLLDDEHALYILVNAEGETVDREGNYVRKQVIVTLPEAANYPLYEG